jgi:hypothetical protein
MSGDPLFEISWFPSSHFNTGINRRDTEGVDQMKKQDREDKKDSENSRQNFLKSFSSRVRADAHV